MKILIVSPYFAPAWAYGGPPRINYEIAKELVKQGHSVEVWTTDALNDKRNKTINETIDGIRIKRFKNISNYLAYKHKIFMPMQFANYTKKHIKNFNFIFTTDLRHSMNPIISFYASILKIPYSISAYGQLHYDNSTKSVLKKVYDIVFGQFIVNNAMFLFGQTDNELLRYTQYYKVDTRKLKLLPLAINYKDFEEIKKQTGFRNKHHIGADDKVLIFVGRINYLKGLDTTLRLFSKINKIVPKTKLIIVGRDDNYLKQLIKLIDSLHLKEKVVFTGPLYGQDNYTAYLESDLFLFTPRYPEETSLAGLAALALGIPVVTVEESQIPFLTEYNAGLEINPNKHKTVQRISEILCNNILLSEMKKNSVKLIKDKYDIPRVVNLLLSYIKNDKQTY